MSMNRRTITWQIDARASSGSPDPDSSHFTWGDYHPSTLETDSFTLHSDSSTLQDVAAYLYESDTPVSAQPMSQAFIPLRDQEILDASEASLQVAAPNPETQLPMPNLAPYLKISSDQPLVEGNYSRIYEGQLHSDPFSNALLPSLNDRAEILAVAIKVLKRVAPKSPESMDRKFKRELMVWLRAQHNNVTPILGLAQGRQFGPIGALISPWYKNGDARRYLDERRETLTFWNRIDFWVGVIAGVEALHSINIVHGDLKPGNILCADDGTPKICDFGLSHLMEEESGGGFTTTSEHTGTARYLAKELLTAESTPPTKASDVWAVGCLGLEIMLNTAPYAKHGNGKLGVIHVYQDIKAGKLPCDFAPGGSKLSSATQDLITRCWRQVVTARPAISTVLRLAHLIQGCELNPIVIPRNHPGSDVSILKNYAFLLRDDEEPGQKVAVRVYGRPVTHRLYNIVEGYLTVTYNFDRLRGQVYRVLQTTTDMPGWWKLAVSGGTIKMPSSSLQMCTSLVLEERYKDETHDYAWRLPD